MLITSFYAGLCGLMLIVLTLRVVAARRRALVAIGDGGDAVLRRRIRAHANFIEYTPLALFLIGIAENQGIGENAVHALCLALLAGRIVHALNISREAEVIKLRIAGMVLTLGAIAIASLSNIYLATFGYLLSPV